MIQKVFGGCRTSGTSTKIIYKPNRIMLQRHRRTARLTNGKRKIEKRILSIEEIKLNRHINLHWPNHQRKYIF